MAASSRRPRPAMPRICFSSGPLPSEAAVSGRDGEGTDGEPPTPTPPADVRFPSRRARACLAAARGSSVWDTLPVDGSTCPASVDASPPASRVKDTVRINRVEERIAACDFAVTGSKIVFSTCMSSQATNTRQRYELTKLGAICHIFTDFEACDSTRRRPMPDQNQC